MYCSNVVDGNKHWRVYSLPLIGGTGMAQQHSTKKTLALGRLPYGVMNAAEAGYFAHLEERKQNGEVLYIKFEGITFKLAKGCTYTPDFVVMLANGQVELHEFKGHWIGDARAKIKVAAAMFPFQFIAVRAEAKCRGGGFIYEEF